MIFFYAQKVILHLIVTYQSWCTCMLLLRTNKILPGCYQGPDLPLPLWQHIFLGRIIYSSYRSSALSYTQAAALAWGQGPPNYLLHRLVPQIILCMQAATRNCWKGTAPLEAKKSLGRKQNICLQKTTSHHQIGNRAVQYYGVATNWSLIGLTSQASE